MSLEGFTSWLFWSRPRDTANCGSAGATAKDNDNEPNRKPPKIINVPSAQSKRASMPDEVYEAGNGNRVLKSRSSVVKKSTERAAKYLTRNETDPIEDDDFAQPVPHTRSASARVSHVSNVHNRPRNIATNGKPPKRPKDSEEDAIRLLGEDTPRQARVQYWSQIEAESGNSKQEEDAIQIPLPGMSRFKQTFAGGLKPMNTFDNSQSRVSAKEQFFNKVTEPLRAGVLVRSKQAHSPDPHYHEGNASKKARLSEMETPTKTQSTSTRRQTGSHHSDGLPIGSKTSARHAQGNGQHPSRSKSLLKDSQISPHAGNTEGSRKHTLNNLQSKSLNRETIDLMSDDDVPEEDFTKNARKQRQRDECLDSPESPVEMARALKASGTKSSYFPSSYDHRSTPPDVQEIFDTPQKRQKTPRAFQDDADDESEDALQIDEPLFPSGSPEERQPLRKLRASKLADAINRGDAEARSARSQATNRSTVKKLRNVNTHEAVFSLKGFKFYNYANHDNYAFVVDPSSKTFFVNVEDQLLDDAPIFAPRNLRMIDRVIFGLDPSDKVIIYLVRDSTKEALTNSPGPQMHLHLGSRKPVSDLTRLLIDLHIKCFEKPADWVEKLYQFGPTSADSIASRERAKQTVMEFNNPKISGAVTESAHFSDKSTIAKINAEKHGKANAQDPRQVAVPQSSRAAVRGGTIVSDAERRVALHQGIDSAQGGHHRSNSDQKLDGRDLETVKETSRPKRVTRSSYSSYDDDAVMDQALNSLMKVKFSQTGGLGAKWDSPLVFPKTGKKREIVNYDDLPRLDYDEFLNDNLVGFFLLYLEHHLEKTRPDLSKRTYFFNSYFYDTLTKSQKGKGINYDGVEKWTRNIDLFKRDFIVVPVNENLHWYVAIICNLSCFREDGQLGVEDDSGHYEDDGTSAYPTGAEVAEISSPHVDDNEISRPQVVSDQPEADEATRSSFQNMHLDDEEQVDMTKHTPSPSAGKPKTYSKKGRGRPRSARKSLPKYNPRYPVIITLDSLGAGRSTTCSALRQYIKLEALSKKKLKIDESLVKGMTAKDIPTQGNYSDCGLYLCAYMEKFALDPSGFVRQILQREPQLWPEMESGDLRARFRDLIMSLHGQQESGDDGKLIPEVGSILLKGPASGLQTQSDAGEEAGKNHPCEPSHLKKVQQIPEPSTYDLQHSLPPNETERQSLAMSSQVRRELNRLSPPILLSDDDEEAPEMPSVPPSGVKTYSRKQPKPHMANGIPEDPRDLARILREKRSPEQYREKRTSPKSAAEKLQEALRQANLEGEAKAQEPRQRREESVDTNYLLGIESYAQGDGVERDRLSEEVPETQQEDHGAVSEEPQEMLPI